MKWINQAKTKGLDLDKVSFFEFYKDHSQHHPNIPTLGMIVDTHSHTLIRQEAEEVFKLLQRRFKPS